MLEGAVDAVEFRRARGFGGPFVVHGCDYDRDCVQESESGLEISCGGVIGFWGIFGRHEGRAGGNGKKATGRGRI